MMTREQVFDLGSVVRVRRPLRQGWFARLRRWLQL